jgi:hypothetical protein
MNNAGKEARTQRPSSIHAPTWMRLTRQAVDKEA